MGSNSLVDIPQLEAVGALLKRIEERLSLPLARALIAIAAEPGMSVNDLAAKLNTPQQSVSRYVAILLGRYQSPTNHVTIPLITLEVNPNDPRSRALSLTRAGHIALIEMISTRGYSRDG